MPALDRLSRLRGSSKGRHPDTAIASSSRSDYHPPDKSGINDPPVAVDMTIQDQSVKPPFQTPISLWHRAVQAADTEDKTLFKEVKNELLDRDDLSDQESGTSSSFATPLEDCKFILAIVKRKQQQKADTKWRVPGKHKILARDVYAGIADWVNKIMDVGDVLAGVDPIHVGLPWAAMKFILKTAIADNEETIRLIRGVETVTSVLCRYGFFEDSYLKQPLSVDLQQRIEAVVIDLYTYVLRFLLHACSLLQRPLFERLRDAVLQNHKLEQLLNDIESKDTQAQEYEGIALATSENNRFVIMDAKFDTLLDDRSQILNWLSDVPHALHQQENVKTALEGTGDWLWQDSRFRDWAVSDRSQLLWLQGDSGCGKTVAVSLALQKLQEDHWKRLHHGLVKSGLAYFYCSHSTLGEARRNPTSILRSIVAQLAATDDTSPLKQQVMDKYRQQKRRRMLDARLLFSDAATLLEALVSEYEQTTIVVDGLNEVDCSDEHGEELLQTFYNLVESNSKSKKLPVVRILVSSQPNVRIAAAFQNAVCLKFNATSNHNDLETIVSKKIDRGLLVDRTDIQSFRDEAKRIMCAKAHGK